MDKGAVIIQGIFTIALVLAYFHASQQNKTSTSTKLILTICTIGVLAFDKIKLVLFIISVSVVWAIKFIISKNKESHGRSA